MPYQTLEAGEFVTRHAEALVRVALTDTRFVAVVGLRQSGQTTVVRRIAEHDDRPSDPIRTSCPRRLVAGDQPLITKFLRRERLRPGPSIGRT